MNGQHLDHHCRKSRTPLLLMSCLLCLITLNNLWTFSWKDFGKSTQSLRRMRLSTHLRINQPLTSSRHHALVYLMVHIRSLYLGSHPHQSWASRGVWLLDASMPMSVLFKTEVCWGNLTMLCQNTCLLAMTNLFLQKISINLFLSLIIFQCIWLQRSAPPPPSIAQSLMLLLQLRLGHLSMIHC